jgi:hypothetical protein
MMFSVDTMDKIQAKWQFSAILQLFLAENRIALKIFVPTACHFIFVPATAI